MYNSATQINSKNFIVCMLPNRTVGLQIVPVHSSSTSTNFMSTAGTKASLSLNDLQFILSWTSWFNVQLAHFLISSPCLTRCHVSPSPCSNWPSVYLPFAIILYDLSRTTFFPLNGSYLCFVVDSALFLSIIIHSIANILWVYPFFKESFSCKQNSRVCTS